ncbi:helix-turn-helix domain-containing protein [Paraburkholderia sacchari]|uniref:LysR family transcriptional regulator n=1 Tax=Paraburkholderia sacchari TaxID=159450 RepID=UPI001BCD072D
MKRRVNVHARSIRYFDMICRCGSIREAARRLHVDGSAVNRQLLNLEEVGATLFERLPGGLRLTEAGGLFAQHVVTVLQEEQRVLLRRFDHASRPASIDCHVLRNHSAIATFCSNSEYFTPPP